jgi:hypothetical protein
MSAGTQEFWVVDAEKRTAQVTDLTATKTYTAGAQIPLVMFDGLTLIVDQIFAI